VRIILDTEIGSKELKRGAAALGIPCTSWQHAGEILPTDVVCLYTLWEGSSRETRVRKRYKPAGCRVLCVDHSWLRDLPDSVQIGWLGEQGVGINGSGTFPPGSLERWRSFGIQIKPWRKDGDFVLVCGNKGAQYSKHSVWLNHDDDWQNTTTSRLLSLTRRPIYYKPHPKKKGEPLVPRVKIDKVLDHRTPLAECLQGAYAVVVYASSSATTALLNGIPVIYTGPTIATRELCAQGLERINSPALPDNREEIFSRLSGSAWRLSEVESGEMFKHVGLVC
jgi:hypothetical protein